MKKIIILGSTGSVGTQTLELIRQKKDEFQVVALSGHSNSKLLLEQAKEFEAQAIYAKEDLAEQFEGQIFSGENGLLDMVKTFSADIVVQATSGLDGLEATLEIIESGANLAMANKELIVCHGEEIMAAVKEYSCTLIPLDSEHSSLFRLLENVNRSEIEKLIITCSGGPFLGKSKEDLEEVTIQDALNHPKWDMGAETTLNSATLMNKALEVAEASRLFDIPINKIEVLIHPECIIHAFLEMKDGAMHALLHQPDMKIPIAYALAYPDAQGTFKLPTMDLTKQSLSFHEVDNKTFPAINAIRQAYDRGQASLKEVYENNLVAQGQYMEGEISFLELLMN